MWLLSRLLIPLLMISGLTSEIAYAQRNCEQVPLLGLMGSQTLASHRQALPKTSSPQLRAVLADQLYASKDGTWLLTQMDANGKLQQLRFRSRKEAQAIASSLRYPLHIADRVQEANAVLRQNGIGRPDPVEADVRAILNQSGFKEGPNADYEFVASRVKSVESARRKLQTYSSKGLYLSDMSDLIGKRIITKDQATAEALAQAVANIFQEQHRLSEPLDRINRASGYRAFHVDTRLRPQDIKLRLRYLRRVPYELQIIPRATYQVYDLDHIYYEFSRSQGRLDSDFHKYPAKDLKAIEAFLKASYQRAHAIDEGVPAKLIPSTPDPETLPAWFLNLARERHALIPH